MTQLTTVFTTDRQAHKLMHLHFTFPKILHFILVIPQHFKSLSLDNTLTDEVVGTVHQSVVAPGPVKPLVGGEYPQQHEVPAPGPVLLRGLGTALLKPLVSSS